MMARYRHKPIEVEAEQWFPDHSVSDVLFPIPDGVAPFEPDETDGLLTAATVEHRTHIRPGDWIIEMPKGYKLVRKPKEFEAEYEPLEAT